MKCVIPGRGIRAFGKAIFCLSKIGDELYIEALEDGMALKTVNSARSAYACFLFQRGFFHSYRDGRSTAGRDTQGVARENGNDALKCKILARSILSVFRALNTLEKTVDHCTLNLDLGENKLVFVFHCKHGVVKTHSLGYQECEALQAVFTKELCPNHIATPAKVLNEVVTHFPSGLEEVTLTAQPSSVKLKNYVEGDSDGTRFSLTEISLAPGEFEQYQVGVDASITFCLKELRAILMFTDAINHSLSLRFEAPGRPVVLSIEDSKDYKADFVLATLLDADSPNPHTTTNNTSTHHRANEHNSHLGSISLQDVQEMEHSIDGIDSTLAENGTRNDPKTTSKNTLSKRDREVSSRPPKANFDFPSGSQFNRSVHSSSTTHHKSQMQTDTHVPPPPTNNPDIDFMDMDIEYGQHTEQSGTRDQQNGGEKDTNVDQGEASTSKTTIPSGDDFDIMDALFGVENLNDVANEGDEFGFGIERGRKQTGKSSIDKPSHTKGKDSEKTKRIGKKISAEQSLLNVVEEASQVQVNTQDSVINDSGFLPSTPPTKKHKSSSYSALFGMDMFTHEHNMSEVLAPDSEDEGS